MKILYSLLPFVIGLALTTQAAVNGQLRTALNSPIMATLVSFLVGTILLVAVILISNQKIPTTAELGAIAWHKYTGGLLGAFIVLAIILSIQNINPSAMFALLVAGQLLTALVFEHFNLFDVKPSPVNWSKVAGVVLLVAGVYLINRKE